MKCRQCKTKLEESFYQSGLSKFCDKDCAVDFMLDNPKKAKSMTDVIAKKKAKEQKKKDRVKLEGMKTASDYIKDAQKAVNRYIRARDYGKPCICCGAQMDWGKYGGAVDAGHYRSRGSAGHLRFNLLNIHAQSVRCNRFHSGNVNGYRLGLIEKIGIELVEKLENDNSIRKFSIEYLKRVKVIFNKRARFYEKRLNNG